MQFLFRLSHQHLGTGYNIKATLSSKEKSLLDDLRNIGLIHAKSKAKRKNYYPTALALSLSSTEDVTLENTLGQGHGKIIVETTMRLYAFTSSEFQIKILRKFVRLDVRLPNLVVGRITNVSISAALRNGITGDGIIMYLEQYASPRMKRNEQTGRALPQTVVGQIRLWEAERNRFSISVGHLLQFSADENDRYKRILEHMQTKESSQQLWHDSRNMFITAAGYEKIKQEPSLQRR